MDSHHAKYRDYGMLFVFILNEIFREASLMISTL